MNDQSRPAGERLGRWMVYAAWFLLLVLLTLLFSGWLDYQHNPNRDLQMSLNQDEASVVLARNRSGHYVAPGLINGEPVVFLLDTGATHVALSDTLADRIGVKRGMASTSMTANGPVRSWLTELDRVQLGPIILRKVRASIMPSMSGNEVLLGMSFLKYLKWTQQEGKLIISTVSDSGSRHAPG